MEPPSEHVKMKLVGQRGKSKNVELTLVNFYNYLYEFSYKRDAN